jgi:hypothetical protein
MLTSTALSTRKPNGYLGAAVHGHSCPAIFADVSQAKEADRPMEAGS